MSDLSSDLTRFLSTTRGPFHYGINYIASPHTHADQEVREARLLAARVVTGDLIEKGVAAFSPDCLQPGPGRLLRHGAGGRLVRVRPALPGLGRGDDHSGTAWVGIQPGASCWNWPLPRRGTSRSNCWVGEKSGPLLEEETIRALEQGLAGR